MPSDGPRAREHAADLVITGATLVDGTGTAPRADITIAIRKGRIAAVAPDGEIQIDPSSDARPSLGRASSCSTPTALSMPLAATPKPPRSPSFPPGLDRDLTR